MAQIFIQEACVIPAKSEYDENFPFLTSGTASF